MNFISDLIQHRESIMLTLFGIMGLILAANMARSLARTGEFIGTPPIPTWLFAAGKAAHFFIWGAFILHLAGYRVSLFPVPTAAEAGGAVLFAAASAFIIASFLALGVTLRFGLSESNELATTGVYRISRNPMYLGFFLLDGAAVLWTLNPLLAALSALAVFTHHRTVLAEERFLSEKFGDAWERYRSNVRRYF